MFSIFRARDATAGSGEKSDSKRPNAKKEFFSGLADGDANETKPDGKKKKKRKHNKESLEERKAMKVQALEGQFAGLEIPNFSGVALNDNSNFTQERVEQPKKKRSKAVVQKVEKKGGKKLKQKKGSED